MSFSSACLFFMSKLSYGCQCLGFLTCTQMLLHSTANGDCTNIVRQSAMKSDTGRKIPSLMMTTKNTGKIINGVVCWQLCFRSSAWLSTRSSSQKMWVFLSVVVTQACLCSLLHDMRLCPVAINFIANSLETSLRFIECLFVDVISQIPPIFQSCLLSIIR